MLEFENEEIHDAARDLIIRPPQCLMNYSGSASAAYQLGVMELARKLTGETAIEADRKMIERDFDFQRSLFHVASVTIYGLTAGFVLSVIVHRLIAYIWSY